MISRKERKSFTLVYKALLKTYKIDLKTAVYEKFMDDFDFRVKTRGSKEAVAFYKQIRLYTNSVIRNDIKEIESTTWVGTENGIPKKFKVLVEMLKSKKLSMRQKKVISSLFDYPSLFIAKCQEYDTSSITDPETRDENETLLIKEQFSEYGKDLNRTLWGSERDLNYVKSKEPPVRITNKSCYSGKLPLKGNGLIDISIFMNKLTKMADSNNRVIQTRDLAIKLAKYVYDDTERTVEYPYLIKGNKIVKNVTAYKAFLYLCSSALKYQKMKKVVTDDKHCYRTHFIAEEFGKERCAVIPNYTINILLEPLDKHYMSLLRVLREDGTFNQDEAFNFVCSNSIIRKFNGNVDQSAWTDKLDKELLKETDKGIIPEEVSLLVNKLFELPVRKTDSEGKLQTIYYARGAGMGTYFVWSRSSIFHHKLVQLCNYKSKLGNLHPKRAISFNPLKKFRDYRIVGDDNTLLNKNILDIYLRTCKSIGLKVSENKTIVTEGKNTSGVFCKRSYLKGKEVSSVTAKMICNAVLSLNNFVDLLRMLNQRKMLDELSDYELSEGLKGIIKPKWLGYLQSPYNEFGKPFITYHPKGNLWESVNEQNFHLYYRFQIYKEMKSRLDGFQTIYTEWGLGGTEYQHYPQGRPEGEMKVDRNNDKVAQVEQYPLLLFAYQRFVEDFIIEYEESTSEYGMHEPSSIESHVLLRIHGGFHNRKDDWDGTFFAEHELDRLSSQPNPINYGESNSFKLRENCRQSVMLKALKGYLIDTTLNKQMEDDETGALDYYSIYSKNYLNELSDERPEWPYKDKDPDSDIVVTTPLGIQEQKT